MRLLQFDEGLSFISLLMIRTHLKYIPPLSSKYLICSVTLFILLRTLLVSDSPSLFPDKRGQLQNRAFGMHAQSKVFIMYSRYSLMETMSSWHWSRVKFDLRYISSKIQNIYCKNMLKWVNFKVRKASCLMRAFKSLQSYEH